MTRTPELRVTVDGHFVANQRADARFLHFNSPDDWLAYNADYGGGNNVFSAMMEHVRGMSEDIAAMEVLGPNPRATLTYAQQFVTRQAALRKAQQRMPRSSPRWVLKASPAS
jgi:hypothetical protein